MDGTASPQVAFTKSRIKWDNSRVATNGDQSMNLEEVSQEDNSSSNSRMEADQIDQMEVRVIEAAQV